MKTNRTSWVILGTSPGSDTCERRGCGPRRTGERAPMSGEALSLTIQIVSMLTISYDVLAALVQRQLGTNKSLRS